MQKRWPQSHQWQDLQRLFYGKFLVPFLVPHPTIMGHWHSWLVINDWKSYALFPFPHSDSNYAETVTFNDRWPIGKNGCRPACLLLFHSIDFLYLCALRLWLKWILNFLCHFSLSYQEITNTAKQETKEVDLSKLNKKTCLNEPQKPKNLHDGKCNQVLWCTSLVNNRVGSC